MLGTLPSDLPEDEDLITSYRRQKVPEFKPNFDEDDEELSDYVKTRLLVARVLALKKYREIWG